MQIPDNQIPTSKPQWLKEWLGKGKCTPLFPEGIRLHYLRSRKPQLGALRFTESGFALTFDGRFRAQWILREGAWTRSCTCTYPKDSCIHTWYMVIVL